MAYLAELSANDVVPAQSESNKGVLLTLDRTLSAPHVASQTTPESIPQPDTTAAETPREYIKDKSGRPSRGSSGRE